MTNASAPLLNTSATAADCFLCRFDLGFSAANLDAGLFGLLLVIGSLCCLCCCYTCCMFCLCYVLPSHRASSALYAPIAEAPN